MITCNPQEITTVSITSLAPGDLFAYSGSAGKITAVVVENDTKSNFLSWLRLSGSHAFAMEWMRGMHANRADANVVKLPQKLDALRVQIEQSEISRKTEFTLGALLIDEHPRIVTAFIANDRHSLEDELWAVSLRDLTRTRPSYGYTCDEWRLLYVPDDLPPEVIASFSVEKERG